MGDQREAYDDGPDGLEPCGALDGEGHVCVSDRGHKGRHRLREGELAGGTRSGEQRSRVRDEELRRILDDAMRRGMEAPGAITILVPPRRG